MTKMSRFRRVALCDFTWLCDGTRYALYPGMRANTQTIPVPLPSRDRLQRVVSRAFDYNATRQTPASYIVGYCMDRAHKTHGSTAYAYIYLHMMQDLLPSPTLRAAQVALRTLGLDKP